MVERGKYVIGDLDGETPLAEAPRRWRKGQVWDWDYLLDGEQHYIEIPLAMKARCMRAGYRVGKTRGLEVHFRWYPEDEEVRVNDEGEEETWGRLQVEATPK